MSKFFIVDENEFNVTIFNERVRLLNWLNNAQKLNPQASFIDLLTAAHDWMQNDKYNYEYPNQQKQLTAAPAEPEPTVEPEVEVEPIVSEELPAPVPETSPEPVAEEEAVYVLEPEELPSLADLPAPTSAPVDLPSPEPLIYDEPNSEPEPEIVEPEVPVAEEEDEETNEVLQPASIPAFPAPIQPAASLNVKNILKEVKNIDTVK
jgi:hypothetical protein